MAKKTPKSFVFYVQESSKKNQITHSYDIAYRMKELSKIDQETFWIFGLDSSHCEIFYDCMHIGGVNSCMADPKIIFKRLLSFGASNFICVHNHPSGNLEPSPGDISLTKKLKLGADILGLQLLDHIIIGGNNYLSLNERDLI